MKLKRLNLIRLKRIIVTYDPCSDKPEIHYEIFNVDAREREKLKLPNQEIFPRGWSADVFLSYHNKYSLFKLKDDGWTYCECEDLDDGRRETWNPREFHGSLSKLLDIIVKDANEELKDLINK